MKSTRFVTLLLVACLFMGACSGEAQVQEADLKAEVFPGTYISNNPANLALPTSGYTIYFVGETHGNRETKQVFRAYLQSLYVEAGVRDVILEEDQSFGSDANAYVHGDVDPLVDGLCLRTDILGIIREFNISLPDEEQVNVHLVDVDSPMPIVYKHLTELHQQLGPAAASVELPDYSDFNTAAPKDRYALVEELQKIAVNQPQIRNGLDTVHISLRWYTLGNRMDTGEAIGSRRTFFPLREDVITQNVQYLVQQLDGKPVMAFFGAAHGMKTLADPNLPVNDFVSWAQRLNESGVPVYSLLMDGASGEGYWRGESFEYGEGLDGYKFENGASIISLFDEYSDADIIYTDLRVDRNQNIQLPGGFPDFPASQVFDALVIFKEFTPMDNACQ